MTLEELKKQAQRLLESTEPVEGFENKSFRCNSGSLINAEDIPELYRDKTFAYMTCRLGAAYSSELGIRCRPTGAKDRKGRAIYATPDEQVFVWDYKPGSPSSFDRGAIVRPLF